MPYRDREKYNAYMREYRKKKKEELEKLKLQQVERERKPSTEKETEGYNEEDYNDLLNVPTSIKFNDFDIWSEVEPERDLPPSEKFKKEPYKMASEQEREIERAIQEYE